MENKFMHQLAQGLIFRSSADEMKTILEDDAQFSADGLSAENPSTIAKTMDESGHRAIFSYAALGLFVALHVWAFAHVRLPYGSFSDFYAVLPCVLVFCVPILFCKTLGEKFRLMSCFYSLKPGEKVRIYGSHLFCFVMILLFSMMIYNSMVPNLAQLSLNVFAVVAAGGLLLFGYFVLTKGLAYFMAACHFYITLCTIFRFKAICTQLTTVEVFSRNLQIAVGCYLAGNLLCAGWLILFKREQRD